MKTCGSKIGLDYGLRRYGTEGGQQSGHPWRTTGFYVQENKRSRLVLEVFREQSGALVVMRVYREQRFKVFCAQKLTRGPERLPLVLTAASSSFRTLLPRCPYQGEEPARPAELAEQVRRALLPAPPPLDISRIEEG